MTDYIGLWKWTWRTTFEAMRRQDMRYAKDEFLRFTEYEAMVVVIYQYIIMGLLVLLVMAMVFCFGLMVYNISSAVAKFMLQGWVK